MANKSSSATNINPKLKRTIKYTGIAIGMPVALIIVLSLLLYFPPFQNWAVSKASAIASEKMGVRVSVGHVRLAFPLDLALDDVRAFEQNDSVRGKTDTVAIVSRAVANVQLLPLFHKQVMVDELSLRDTQLNTTHFVSDLRVSGKIGELKVKAHGIDLSKERVRVNRAILNNANLLVELSDTAKKDTVKTANFWKINLDEISIRNTAFALHTPGDTISVALLMNKGKAQGVYMDLFKNLYSVRRIDWAGGWLNYDKQPSIVAKTGFDPNHIAVEGLQLKIDSFLFCSPSIKLNVLAAAFHEKCGLDVANVKGAFRMDSVGITLPELRLKTPSSDILLAFKMDMNAFSTDLPADSTGSFAVNLHGTLGSKDLMTLASPYTPHEICNIWPRVPLVVDGKVGGNLHRLHINGLHLSMPEIMKVNADGFVANVTSPASIRANMNVNALASNLAFVTPMLPKSVTSNINIPRGISLRGNVKLDGKQLATKFSASQGGGTIGGSLSLDMKRMAYDANIKSRRMPIAHFLKHQPVHPFTGSIVAHGSGTDFLSPNTNLRAAIDIKALGYDKYNLDGINLTASLNRGHLVANANCHNKALKGNIGLDALLSALHVGNKKTSVHAHSRPLPHRSTRTPCR